MQFPRIQPLRDALRGMFTRSGPRPDALSAKVAASPAVLFQINHSAALGRHAVAKAALAGKPAGTLLLRENCYIWVATASARDSVCHACALDLTTIPSSRRITCGGCDGQTHYCSVKCRDGHAVLHQSVCKIVRDAPSLAVRHHAPLDLVYALLALAGKRAAHLHSVATSSHSEILPSNPIEFDAGPMAFSQMIAQSGTQPFSGARRSLQALAGSIAERMPAEKRPPLDLFHTWASQINANSHSLFRDHKPYDPIGFGLFPLASIFNHSCLPNCTYTNEGAHLTIRLLRPVSEGEELCINYTELYSARDERRAELKASKFFECRCRRCTQTPATAEEVRLIGAEPFISAVLCDQTPGCPGLLMEDDILTDRLGDRNARWECSVCHAHCTYGHILDTHLSPLRRRLQEAMLVYSQGLAGTAAASLRERFEAILQSARERLHPSHAIIFNCYLPLINCCSVLKDYAAKEIYSRALVEIASASLPAYPPLANYFEAFAQSLQERIQTKPALARETRETFATESSHALQRALQIYQDCHGATHPKTLQVAEKLRRAQTAAKPG